MKLKISLVLLLISLVCFVRAQDASFSQYYGNPMYLNPALAGSKICPRLTLNYRNQWPSIPGNFVTYAVGFDRFVDAVSGGVGLMVMSENMADGILTNTSVSGMYSYRVNLSKLVTMNAGIEATYMQNKLNWGKLIFADQLNNWDGTANNLPPTSETPPDRLSLGLVDFSAGLLLGYRERVYGGVAVNHLTQPDNSFYSNGASKLDMKMTVHAGALIDMRDGIRSGDVEDLSISPNIMYQQQGQFHQLNLGLYLNVYPFVIGGWFRHNFENPDAVIALVGFQHEKFKIGYSYDYTVSRLTNITGGAHEVSFAWQFDCGQKTIKQRAIKCPRF
ncbi:MAG: type IX secretion system membrane protein PorP/SprF [Lentimicrobiaceae bacterium]|nr:type IX secretion system membrane protein PorP/SprF [Lentimicrobiaceae bacterium]